MIRRHWGIWLPVLIGWTLVGLTFTLNYYFFAGHYVAIFKQQPSLKEMLIWELPYWFLWAALSPVIFRITRRFRIERGSFSHLLTGLNRFLQTSDTAYCK